MLRMSEAFTTTAVKVSSTYYNLFAEGKVFTSQEAERAARMLEIGLRLAGETLDNETRTASRATFVVRAKVAPGDPFFTASDAAYEETQKLMDP